MRFNHHYLQLYLITDPFLCLNHGLVQTVEAALKGGVTMVQLRDKQASTQDRIAQGLQILPILNAYRVPLVINDDIEAAACLHAAGVHVGQGDLPPSLVRERLGEQVFIGLSCENQESVIAANMQDVDYLGLSPVFATQTKSDHQKPIGFSGLSKLCRLTTIPVVALGGLKAEHTVKVFRAGAKGMAVVSAICGQDNPFQQALRISQIRQNEVGL